jgi:hypothetical protein
MKRNDEMPRHPIGTYMIEVNANSDDCFMIAFTVILLVRFLTEHN